MTEDGLLYTEVPTVDHKSKPKVNPKKTKISKKHTQNKPHVNLESKVGV